MNHAIELLKQRHTKINEALAAIAETAENIGETIDTTKLSDEVGDIQRAIAKLEAPGIEAITTDDVMASRRELEALDQMMQSEDIGLLRGDASIVASATSLIRVQQNEIASIRKRQGELAILIMQGCGINSGETVNDATIRMIKRYRDHFDSIRGIVNRP